jgi:hypothetical protein
VADGGRGGIVLRGDEFYVVKFEAQIIDGLLDKIGILVALAPELWRRHSNEKNSATRVAVVRRLQPGIVGVPVDLFFQRIENAHPRIGGECCACH